MIRNLSKSSSNKLHVIFNQNYVSKCFYCMWSKPIEGTRSVVREDESDFLPLELYPSDKRKNFQHTSKENDKLPPRSQTMKTDQDWASVWPTARSFHPDAVPLDVRQGYIKKEFATPDKW